MSVLFTSVTLALTNKKPSGNNYWKKAKNFHLWINSSRLFPILPLMQPQITGFFFKLPQFTIDAHVISPRDFFTLRFFPLTHGQIRSPPSHKQFPNLITCCKSYLSRRKEGKPIFRMKKGPGTVWASIFLWLCPRSQITFWHQDLWSDTAENSPEEPAPAHGSQQESVSSQSSILQCV